MANPSRPADHTLSAGVERLGLELHALQDSLRRAQHEIKVLKENLDYARDRRTEAEDKLAELKGRKA